LHLQDEAALNILLVQFRQKPQNQEGVIFDAEKQTIAYAKQGPHQ
jgi:hypothetical protein